MLGDQVELRLWPAPEQAPPPAEALEGADAVVHLLGEPSSAALERGRKAGDS